jgi:GDP-fucose protein O-fucosyltransferase
MGGAPSLPAARMNDHVRLGVYFDRDSAGLSNLRLQLESMVAICKVFGRFLVLPPPQTIQHLNEPYHETMFWSMSHLSSHIPIVLAPERQPPDDAYEVRDQISSFSLNDLPPGDHWYFTKDASRIQHFEALRLPEAKRQDAARCVFESFELSRTHHAVALRLLKKVGLEQYAYISVHLRRGDFRTFRPQGYKSAGEISRSLAQHVHGKVLVIASDAKKDDPEIEELKLVPGATQTVILSREHDTMDDLLNNAAVEMLICRWGEKFLGTHDSTFTNGIFSMRRKDSKTTRKDLDASPVLLFGDRPVYECEGVCWNKVTNYGGARWL